MTRKGQILVGQRPSLLVIKNLQPDQLSQSSLDHSPARWMCKLFRTLPFENGYQLFPLLPEIPAEEAVTGSREIFDFLFTGSKLSTCPDNIIDMFHCHFRVATLHLVQFKHLLFFFFVCMEDFHIPEDAFCNVIGFLIAL